jgi:hypothetical protein
LSPYQQTFNKPRGLGIIVLDQEILFFYLFILLLLLLLFFVFALFDIVMFLSCPMCGHSYGGIALEGNFRLVRPLQAYSEKNIATVKNAIAVDCRQGHCK